MPQIDTVIELVFDKRRYSEKVRKRAREAPTATTNKTYRDSCLSARIKSGESAMSDPETWKNVENVLPVSS